MRSERPQKINEYHQRREDGFRSAWNRIGKYFQLSQKDVKEAKQAKINPYVIWRDRTAYTADSVRLYIQTSRSIMDEEWFELDESK